jgi:hypothetical protein
MSRRGIAGVKGIHFKKIEDLKKREINSWSNMKLNVHLQ